MKSVIKSLFSYSVIVGSFGILDAWLRVMTRWIGAYSIYELAPNLFTLLWAILLTLFVTSFKSRKAGRIVYGVLYYLSLAYAVVQYGAYRILGKFLYISDFIFAGEGADYASWVMEFIDLPLILQVAGLVVVGIAGLLFFPERPARSRKKQRMALAFCIAAGMLLIPNLYGPIASGWDGFRNPRFEYNRFVSPNFDMELTGMYQYIVKDGYNQISRRVKKALGNTDQVDAQIDAFFDKQEAHEDNPMTGVFEGKNLIVVMLESIDDWMITPEDMPALYRMKSGGIDFTQFYTPEYSTGYTFNTEFAFHTSIYPYSNGNVAYTLANNAFPLSLASMFKDAGYKVHSYHASGGVFYNRASMHEAFGYEKYHSYFDYGGTGQTVYVDRYLVECDELYQSVTDGEPFMSYVISYSAHLPYSDDDELARLALKTYPQYDVQENRELGILRAKARQTDDMFAGLLRRLEEDGTLDDTVIVAFSDHYAYGLSDTQLLKALSAENGSEILERTAAFVYCSEWENPLQVDKTMQITDLAPTLMNLFGLDVPKEIMGRDIFDPNYEGMAIFPGNTWIKDGAYVKNGALIEGNGLSDEEIKRMNAYVQEAYIVNDEILNVDYYAR